MLIRYDSPSLAGFTFTTTWGNDDTWTVNAGWAGKFGDTAASVAVGYSDNNSPNESSNHVRQYSVNGSLTNIASSGLFVQGAYEVGDDDTLANDKVAWQVKGGWSKNVNGLGNTGIFGIYQKSIDFGQGVTVLGVTIAESEAIGYGVGLTQDLDAVGATVFGRYDVRSVESLVDTLGNDLPLPFDLTTITAGMTVRF
jgi:hypothetical protein